MRAEFNGKTDVARNWVELKEQVKLFLNDLPQLAVHEVAPRWNRLFQAYFESDYSEDVMV